MKNLAISCELRDAQPSSTYGKIAKMDCPVGYGIYVEKAEFGYWNVEGYLTIFGYPSNICDYGEQTYCSTTIDLSAIIKSACDGKQNCKFHGHSGLDGDPCHGTRKFTKIDYVCKKNGKYGQTKSNNRHT